jgi:hypothetical protein
VSPAQYVKQAIHHLTGARPTWGVVGGWDVRESIEPTRRALAPNVRSAVGVLLTLLDDLEPGGEDALRKLPSAEPAGET